jgi:hypothetical protein
VLASREVLVVVWLEPVWLVAGAGAGAGQVLVLYQPDGPQPPERSSSKAAERADLGSRDDIKANGNDNDNYNYSETHLRAQYPPHFTPARAGRPTWLAAVGRTALFETLTHMSHRQDERTLAFPCDAPSNL